MNKSFGPSLLTLPPNPPEDIEKVLNIKKKEVAGLESLLRLHKFTG